jgi:hypothetical protein
MTIRRRLRISTLEYGFDSTTRLVPLPAPCHPGGARATAQIPYVTLRDILRLRGIVVTRAAVALLVLSMSGLPAVRLLCDVLCTPAATSTHSVPCHGQTSQQPRLAVGGHHCDHSQNVVSVVIRSTSGSVTLPAANIVASARVAEPLRLPRSSAASPPGDSSLLQSFRTISLRI